MWNSLWRSEAISLPLPPRKPVLRNIYIRISAKMMYFFPSCFETDPGLLLRLLLTSLDSSSTLNLTWFFPVLLLQMEFWLQGMKIDRTYWCLFCYSLASLWSAAKVLKLYLEFRKLDFSLSLPTEISGKILKLIFIFDEESWFHLLVKLNRETAKEEGFYFSSKIY